MTATRRASASRSELSAADVDVLLAASVRAPSVHNTQPWQFGVGRKHVELYADPARHLRAADPTGRELLVSCGAALFNLRVAAEHLGLRPRVRLLPEDLDPTLVAIVTLDHRHSGRGGLAGYYETIPDRRTNRAPFRDRRVPPTLLGLLGDAARAEGAMLRAFDDPDEVARLVGLMRDADSADVAEPARLLERAAWVGVTDRADGVPAGALGPRPVDDRSAFRDLGLGVVADRREASFESTPTLAVLSTQHDRPVDWVRAGQALERLLLEATRAGLSASFANQPLEHEQMRWLVRNARTGVGHSQMVIRLGYGTHVPSTLRRPLDAVRRTAALDS